jgi:hypothetical protein
VTAFLATALVTALIHSSWTAGYLGGGRGGFSRVMPSLILAEGIQSQWRRDRKRKG